MNKLVLTYIILLPYQCAGFIDSKRVEISIVSRIAKLLFVFLVIQQGLARRDKRAHGRERNLVAIIMRA